MYRICPRKNGVSKQTSPGSFRWLRSAVVTERHTTKPGQWQSGTILYLSNMSKKIYVRQLSFLCV